MFRRMQANKVNCSRLVFLVYLQASLWARMTPERQERYSGKSSAQHDGPRCGGKCAVVLVAVQWTPAASGRQYFPRERVPEYYTKAAAVEGALVFRYLVQYCRNGLRIRVSVAPLVLPRQDGR